MTVDSQNAAPTPAIVDEEKSSMARLADTAGTEASNVAATAAEGAKEIAGEASTQTKAVVSQAKQQVDSLITQTREEVRQQAETRSAQAAGGLQYVVGPGRGPRRRSTRQCRLPPSLLGGRAGARARSGVEVGAWWTARSHRRHHDSPAVVPVSSLPAPSGQDSWWGEWYARPGKAIQPGFVVGAPWRLQSCLFRRRTARGRFSIPASTPVSATSRPTPSGPTYSTGMSTVTWRLSRNGRRSRSATCCRR